jgi:hypothetical protein
VLARGVESIALASSRPSRASSPAHFCGAGTIGLTSMRLPHGFGELFRQNRSLDQLIVVALAMELQPDVGHLVEGSACRQREGSFKCSLDERIGGLNVPMATPLTCDRAVAQVVPSRSCAGNRQVGSAEMRATAAVTGSKVRLPFRRETDPLRCKTPCKSARGLGAQ